MILRPRRLVSAVLTVGLVAILASHLASQTAAPTPLTVLSKDGRRPLALTLVNDQEFVAIDDLATFFQLTVREDTLGALTVNYKGRTIVLTPDQALASVAGRLVALPAPTSRVGRRWLVPVEFVNRALALIYDAKLDLRKSSHLLVVGDLRVPRVTVRYDLVAPGARLTIDATPRATSTVTQDNERLTIKFDADALDIASPPLAPPGPQALVQAVRILDAVTLAVDLGPRNAGFRATSQPVDTTTRLTIDVTAVEAPATTPAAPSTPSTPSTPATPVVPVPPATVDVPPLLGAPVATIRTIAIDPGHGGKDDGAKGVGGTKEKDVTLALARRIKAAIEARLGIRVLLTRDDDRDLAVDDRTAIANNNKADLFISLHANASLRPSTTGASIYYAAFDPKPKAVRATRRAPSVSRPLAAAHATSSSSPGTSRSRITSNNRSRLPPSSRSNSTTACRWRCGPSITRRWPSSSPPTCRPCSWRWGF